MSPEDFEKSVKDVLDKVSSVMFKKNVEYSRDGNRMHNFEAAGRILNCSPAQVLLGMKVKHDVSILDIVKDIDDGRYPSESLLDEKIVDSINYLLILRALLIEEIPQNI